MRSTGTLCRRGTSTILGTLIFVGIMLTAVIPMLLVMNQADTFHEMRKYELEFFDEERIEEEVYVNVFSTPDTSPPILTLRVENRGNFIVKIVKIWINDSPHLFEDFVVQPMSLIDRQLDYFTADPETHYLIKVITDRGNLFYEESGSIYCNIDGDWETGSFAIFFIISYPAAGMFNVEVRFSNENYEILGLVPEGEFSIHKSSPETAFDFIDVPTEGIYHVKITKSSEIIHNDFETIPWPNGPRSATVRT